MITDCDRKLTLQATRAEALVRTRNLTGARRTEKEEMEALVRDIGDVPPHSPGQNRSSKRQLKADTYTALRLKPTYAPETQQVRAEASLDPHKLG